MIITLTASIFQYHFEKDGIESIENVCFHSIEAGYIRHKESLGYKIIARYIKPLAERID